jgi:hypothetical protein
MNEERGGRVPRNVQYLHAKYIIIYIRIVVGQF